MDPQGATLTIRDMELIELSSDLTFRPPAPDAPVLHFVVNGNYVRSTRKLTVAGRAASAWANAFGVSGVTLKLDAAASFQFGARPVLTSLVLCGRVQLAKSVLLLFGAFLFLELQLQQQRIIIKFAAV